MASSNKHLSKRVDLLALDHLGSSVGSLQDAEQSKRCKEALQVLADALHVSPQSRADRYKYGLDATLAELVSVASETFGSNSSRNAASASSSQQEDALQSAKFAKYLELVKKKGAFDGLSETDSAAMLDKVKRAFLQKFEPSKADNSMSREEAEKLAEQKKLEGNDKLTQREFQAAVDLYSDALDLSPSGPQSHIYLSNRAAAYTHLKEYELASQDCHESIALRPDFSKAHSRLAQAQFTLGNLEQAKQSAQRALELDSQNGVAIATLDAVRDKEKASSAATTTTNKRGGNAAAAAGMGGLGGLAGLMGGMGGGGGGGMPDLSQMMNNPMMAEMMKDPQMMAMAQQMASDPNAMKNLMGMMGGGGGRQ